MTLTPLELASVRVRAALGVFRRELKENAHVEDAVRAAVIYALTITESEAERDGGQG